MARRKGDVTKSGTKSNIINFILENSGSVEESQIREYLKKKNEKIDQGNVNRYLHELREEFACIELETIKKGERKYNLWNITKVQQLKKIRDHFKEIKLNTYEKSLNIILQEQVRKGYLLGVDSTHARQLRVQLSLSISFFNICLENDFESLYDKAEEIYQLGEGFDYTKYIEDSTHELYTKHISQISVGYNNWIAVYNEFLNNPLRLEFCQNSLKSFPNVEISEDIFLNIFESIKVMEVEALEWKTKFVNEFAIKLASIMSQKLLNETTVESKEKSEKILNKVSRYILEKMLEEIPILKEEMSDQEHKFFYVEDLSAKITYEIFQKMLLEIPVEVLKAPEEFDMVWIEVLKKILHEVLKKIIEAPYEMYEKIYAIKLHWYVRRKSIDKILFEHFFHRDIIDGTVSSNERDFMAMMKNLKAKDNKGWKEENNAIDEFYRNYMRKCREKREAHNIYIS